MRARRGAGIHPLLDAGLAWGNLGLQCVEMMAASGHVILHRTRRHNTPAQLMEMGSEKMLAALQSSSAMTRQMMALPGLDAFALWDAWARLIASGVAPFRVRAVRNARLARRR